jgi:hypothetical protein
MNLSKVQERQDKGDKTFVTPKICISGKPKNKREH